MSEHIYQDDDSDFDEQEYIPRAEQAAYGFTPSEAATTEYTQSMAAKERRDDDAETRVTSYTYSSTEDARKFLKVVDSRTFNNLNEAYFLPSDAEEWSRLDKQHVVSIIAHGSYTPVPSLVQALLAPENGVTKRILDLGCGSGVWATDMAREYPHCQVVGVDLAPTPIDTQNVMPNCRFEVDDINLGLAHFRDQFDLIHARAIVAGIHDYKKTMSDVHQCLKPSGIVFWSDADYDMHTGAEFTYLPPAEEGKEGGGWLARMMYEMRRAAVSYGKSDFKGMSKCYDEGLWEDPFLDPETCKTAVFYLPIGPWAKGKDVHQTQKLRYIGSLLRQDFMSVHRAIHPVLKKVGWPAETINEWSRLADEELMEGRHSMSVRGRLAWGRRRAAPGQPAPPVPPSTQATSSSDVQEEQPYPTYPFMFINNTKEESLREAQGRNAEKESVVAPPGPPPPTRAEGTSTAQSGAATS